VVRTGHSEEILDQTLRREIEVGLVREIRHPSIEAMPLYEDDVVLVAEPGHPFAEAGQIPVERIREARLILFDRTSSYYDLANAIVRAAGVSPRGVMELDNIDAAKEMVGQGLGVALLPTTAVADEVASGELSIVGLLGTAPIRRRIVAIRRNDVEGPSGNLAAFYAVLKDIDEVLPKPR
jgi:DNA-binding transcriptional LysR family regulator